jgi:hypothetical protein
MIQLFLRLQKERGSSLYVVPSAREGSSTAISPWTAIEVTGINYINPVSNYGVFEGAGTSDTTSTT